MINAGFILLSIVLAGVVLFGVSSTVNRLYSDASKRRQIKIRAALFLDAWLLYIALVSFTGIFTSTALPPRIPLLLVLPAFAFMIWFFRSERFKAFIDTVPHAWLVYLQSFRIIVELLLHASFLKGLLPRAATFEGYNFEIVIGVSALIVGYLGFTKKLLSKTMVIIWNYLGLCTLAVVVFIILSYAYFPALWPHDEGVSMKEFGVFPITLLPGFLMPLAVFLHIFSIIKLKRDSRHNHLQ